MNEVLMLVDLENIQRCDLGKAPPNARIKIFVGQTQYRTLLPVYSLRAAAGYFGAGMAVEPEGWIDVSDVGRIDKDMFVARVIGRSMEPLIRDGEFCVFRAKPAGSRQGRIVLVQYRGPSDPETGGTFTVKRYRSKKLVQDDGTWQHEEISLEPMIASFFRSYSRQERRVTSKWPPSF